MRTPQHSRSRRSRSSCNWFKLFLITIIIIMLVLIAMILESLQINTNNGKQVYSDVSSSLRGGDGSGSSGSSGSGGGGSGSSVTEAAVAVAVVLPPPSPPLQVLPLLPDGCYNTLHPDTYQHITPPPQGNITLVCCSVRFGSSGSGESSGSGGSGGGRKWSGRLKKYSDSESVRINIEGECSVCVIGCLCV